MARKLMISHAKDTSDVVRVGRLAAALFAVLGVIGCSDSIIQGSVVSADAQQDSTGYLFGDTSSKTDTPKADLGTTQGEDGEVAVSPEDVGPGVGQLLFGIEDDNFGGKCIDTCALVLTQNTVRTLPVRYLVGGKPVENAIIEFALEDPANTIGELLAGNVPTDPDGKASTDVKAGAAQGTFKVLARVPEDPAAGELVFEMHVTSKAKGQFSVTLHYQGSKSLSEFGLVQVRLAKQDKGQPACSGIDLGGPLPASAWQSPTLIKWDKPWSPTYTNFPSWVQQQGGEVAFTVIGVGGMKAGSALLAAGCVDTGATVTWNPVTKTVEGDAVTVNVMDIPPRLQGVYDLHSYIDLISILPDGVEMVLKTILNIVTDPVAGILALVCNPKISKDSLISLCKNIFDQNDPAYPNIKNLAQPFGGIIVQFLNGILLSVLPDNIKTGLNTGADLAEILTNLEMVGTIELKAEPDNTGFLPKEQTKEVWMKVVYKWTLGKACNAKDPACGKDSFNIEAFQSDAIVGQFDLWRDALKSEVKIGLHGLNIKWGALVNHVVQKVVLPALTKDPKDPPGTPPIDTYAEFIKSLLAGKKCLLKDTCCADFGAQLATKQSIIKADFLATACELMVTVGVGFLESQLVGLDVDSGDPAKKSGLLLAADKCPIFEIDDDQKIDSIGMETLPCNWDMTLTIGGKPQAIKSTFFATRQQ